MMRILRLDIQNVRGIRSLVLTPNGRNLVIWGPNGSGKSAVVDAIDFLLTGRVTRLTGKGTAGLSLVKHGPHIDSTPDTATVTALLEIPGVDRPVEIRRCIAHPDVLECEEEIMPKLQPVLEVAGRGQHVLSRREILRFITAEAATRAEEIQALLDLSEIEEIRKTLVRVRNDSDKDLDASVKALEAAKTAVNVTLQCKTFDPRAVLDTANRERAVLGGVPIPAIKSSLLKSDLSLPKSAMGDQSINVTILEKDFTNLTDLC
jgi:predicted ATPase